MLKFAGYVLAGAGSATGVWTATNAASDAVVGFATSALESAYGDELRRKQQAESYRDKTQSPSWHFSTGSDLQPQGQPLLPLQSSSGGGAGPATEGEGATASARGAATQQRSTGPRGGPVQARRAHRRFRQLSNLHRHQTQVEPLDLALPAHQLALILAEPVVSREVIAAVLNCTMICAVCTVLHGWLLILRSNSDARKHVVSRPSKYYLQAVYEDIKASEDESPEILLEEDSTEAASPFSGLTVNVRVEEGSQEGGLWDVPRPVTPDTPHGLHNSGLHRAPSTGLMARNNSGLPRVPSEGASGWPSATELALSSTTVRTVRSANRIKPTLEEIRRYFMLEEERGGDGGSDDGEGGGIMIGRHRESLDPALERLSTSVPEFSARVPEYPEDAFF